MAGADWSEPHTDLSICVHSAVLRSALTIHLIPEFMTLTHMHARNKGDREEININGNSVGSADTDHYLFRGTHKIYFANERHFFRHNVDHYFWIGKLRFFSAAALLFFSSRVFRFSVRRDVSQFIVFKMSDTHGHSCTGTHFRANNLHLNCRNLQNHLLAFVMRAIDCNNIYRSRSWSAAKSIWIGKLKWNVANWWR